MKKSDIIIKSNAIFNGCIAAPVSGIVAVKGNQIQYVGDEAMFSEFLGEDTKVYDMGDRLVMPGLHDAHLHFYMSGLYASPLVKVSLTDTSEEQCVAGLAEIADSIPKDKWLIGAGWYHPIWENPVLPTKKSLDKVYPDRPVCMVSGDCHTMWFNSEGLKKLGLNDDVKDPVGGHYGRLDNGELSGTVHESAATALVRQIYDFTEEEENGFYRSFIKQLNAYGITSVCDVSMMAAEGADFIRDDIYERLLENDELTVRVNMYPTLRMDLSRAREMREKYDGEILRCQGVKQFMDGVSSCHTAYLKEDYANAEYPGDRGKATVPEEKMRELILNAHKNDISARVHTIGDQAIHVLLDYFEEANERYGYKPYLQHTLEHLENFQVEDIERLARLHVLPSVQPPHALIDPEGVERDLGVERVKDMWPFRRLIDAGCTLAFGTDSPVVDINPFHGIYNAVTRQSAFTKEPEGGWLPTEKITLAEALSSYTYGSACAASRTDKLGTLSVGKLADICVLDRNLFEKEPEEILQAKVIMTMMDGKIVYEGN